MTFSSEGAERLFWTENTGMWNTFEPVLRKRLSELDSHASTADRVRSVLLELLPSGRSPTEDAASKLAISKRTMLRRLSEKGASFQVVLKTTRQQLAEHYLSNSELSQAEVSFLLSFQDSNSFLRAFNSWTGITPGLYRRTH